jgi:hypothetical protein
MANLFMLSRDDIDALLHMLEGSGVTVVWLYAPGYVSPDGLNPRQMEELTGFRLSRLDEPGPMMVRATLPGPRAITELSFGVRDSRSPRFVISDADTVGVWTDTGLPACGVKERDGWRSVYMGTAPLPVEVLRWLMDLAGARCWSTKTDIVLAAEDAALLVATSKGIRTVALHKPLAQWGHDEARKLHTLEIDEGEVMLFFPPSHR